MRPLLSYFAVQEIPAALVTFVSLLMFIQTGTSPALSTCYSALLSLPWVVKIVIRRRRSDAMEAERRGLSFAVARTRLLWSEFGMVILLLLLAAVLNPGWPLLRMLRAADTGGITLFLLLFALSYTTAWHEVQADVYYHYRLRPSLRTFYDAPRLLVSQGMVVVTYGLLMVFVGTIQVITHSIFVSWSIACQLTAGIMSLAVFWHLFSFFSTSQVAERTSSHAVRRPNVARQYAGWFLFFLFMMPQALMFYTRVLFMMDTSEEGGLARSLQEVGFLHGVIGALGFCVGLLLSRYLIRRHVHERNRRRSGMRFGQYTILTASDSYAQLLSGRRVLLVLPLLLSPLLYVYLSYFPPRWLWQIAVCTFLAQFMFGYGLHRLLSILGIGATGSLRVPIISSAMLLPMAASGWLCSVMSYQQFFLLDALTALLPLVYLVIKNRGANDDPSPTLTTV